MKFGFLLFALSLSACGMKSGQVDFGKTTKADLYALKGGPLKEEALPMKDAQILTYPENEKYQVKNDLVTHGFRDPKGDEKLVLYWRHKFKNCDSQETTLPHQSSHTPLEVEFHCPVEGVSVIFFQGSEFVTRIIEHAKK
jgi:hypothetical protein